jgi:hypothetical protein
MSESKYKRDFKGVWIPREVWLSSELTIMEKLFYVEIDSLDNESGCFASNAHFSDFFSISNGRCTQIIKSLEKKGFVKVRLEYSGKEISKRVVEVVNKLNTLPAKTKYPYLENDEGNNTYINNTLYIGDESPLPKKKERNVFTKPTLEMVNVYKMEILGISDIEAFVNYHEARGWMMGRNKMKDWKAAFRTWEKNAVKWREEKNDKRSNNQRRQDTAKELNDYTRATDF